ncbi:MAG TPA: DUF1003 domain-containing protein [Caulobacteraceae bacterium]|jgi:uncharacterized membrane protein|nr:DUF1003 domain-containing protein [Caulobacteraceae bacterium]
MSEDMRAVLCQTLLGRPYEELSDLQKDVIDLVASRTPSKEHPALAPDDRTYWERLADHVAAVGGSWSFIFGFGIVLVAWIGSNLLMTLFRTPAFDPYPFIFLNLMLSMLAAIQAPVIMMSQNRAAAKDRQAAEHDYIVNMRAEFEIMHLHDKLDSLRSREMMEVIERQNETLELLRQQIATLSNRVGD